jgi:putative pyruvate formate lyase activating enzyme
VNPRVSPRVLRRQAKALFALASPCRLCPNECGVDRLSGETGRCGIGFGPRIYSSGPHFGEEPALVGTRGSGTVFFSGCNLACVFCQNWEISQEREGHDLSLADLAKVFLDLQAQGCHNLNLVTPTHQAHAIVAVLAVALEAGFHLPIVWNCGGYESVQALRLLDGIVDIYMPDLKYGDNAVGQQLSGVPDYSAVATAAVREMHRQVGDLALDEHGIATRGLLVRHLVLPNSLADTETVARFLAEEVSKDTYTNVMAQYRPMHRAASFPEIARPVTDAEYDQAGAQAALAGLRRFAG